VYIGLFTNGRTGLGFNTLDKSACGVSWLEHLFQTRQYILAVYMNEKSTSM